MRLLCFLFFSCASFTPDVTVRAQVSTYGYGGGVQLRWNAR